MSDTIVITSIGRTERIHCNRCGSRRMRKNLRNTAPSHEPADLVCNDCYWPVINNRMKEAEKSRVSKSDIRQKRDKRIDLAHRLIVEASKVNPFGDSSTEQENQVLSILADSIGCASIVDGFCALARATLEEMEDQAQDHYAKGDFAGMNAVYRRIADFERALKIIEAD